MSQERSSKRLNVLFVVFDDLRPELACYGHPQIVSPHIDALARDGVLFQHAYCQQAICAPSRASVLSGCRPDTTRVYDLQTPLRSAMPDVVSMPEHFKNHGYETVSIGKVYHHAKDDLQGWSTDPFQSQGDWKGRGYLTDEAIEAMRENDAVLARAGVKRHGLGPAFEAADVPDEGYHDGKDAAAAIKELGRLSRLDRPFFMGLGFHKPHLPFNSPKRYWDLYERDAIQLAENPFEPDGVTPYSLTNFGELRAYFGMPDDGPIPDGMARELKHAYYACVSYVDAQFGRVVAELRRLGLYDDTVIMLWGDHGWKLGEHASWSKHTNFEIDTRAPMIVRLPGARANGTPCPALTEFVDMYPTLCDVCDLPMPEHLEGLSLAPLLQDAARPWKAAAFSQYPRGDVMGYTMRTSKFRYTEWRDRESGELRATELYDHRSDSQENANVAARPEHAETVASLARQMARGWREAGPPR